MHALDRKLLRDFRRLWAQALAIALVLACGVAILLTTFGTYISLEETRTAYYERNRFADVFADATRAPRCCCATFARSRAFARPTPGLRNLPCLTCRGATKL